MVVEVGPEIEQLVFEVCRRPEQHVIQVFPPRNRHQIDMKNPLFGAANFELASPLAASVATLTIFEYRFLERQRRKSLCQFSHPGAPEACSSVMDTNSAASPCKLDQDLRRYVEFLVQSTNHVER